MKKAEPVYVDTVVEIVCDRCQKCFKENGDDWHDDGWHEIQSLEFVGGYESIFGDGSSVSVDLCQHCLKETLGQWLRIEAAPWCNPLEKHPMALFDNVTGDLPRSSEAKDTTGDVLNEPSPEKRETSREDPGDVPPPKGYQSWLQYAVDSMDTRSLEIDNLFDADDHLANVVTRDAMRASAQKELQEFLTGSASKSRPPIESGDDPNATDAIDTLKGDPPIFGTAAVSIDDVHARASAVDKLHSSAEEWPNTIPVGLEFGADSVRFTQVLEQAISVFGNPLAAVQWLTTSNGSLGAQPMQRVIDSAAGSDEVTAMLVDMGTPSR